MSIPKTPELKQCNTKLWRRTQKEYSEKFSEEVSGGEEDHMEWTMYALPIIQANGSYTFILIMEKASQITYLKLSDSGFFRGLINSGTPVIKLLSSSQVCRNVQRWQVGEVKAEEGEPEDWDFKDGIPDITEEHWVGSRLKMGE